jgi:hypothetical protein
MIGENIRQILYNIKQCFAAGAARSRVILMEPEPQRAAPAALVAGSMVTAPNFMYDTCRFYTNIKQFLTFPEPGAA